MADDTGTGSGTGSGAGSEDLPAEQVEIGEELLDVPFPEMVEKLMVAIAKGQMALDVEAANMAQMLAQKTLPAGSVITAIIEHRKPDGSLNGYKIQTNKQSMPLLVYGIKPTFYQVSEAVVEVKIAISLSSEESYQKKDNFYSKYGKTEEGKTDVSVKGALGWWWTKVSFGYNNKVTHKTSSLRVSTVDAKYSQKYSYKADGASLLKLTIRPVPPPHTAAPPVIVVKEEGSKGSETGGT